MVESCEDVGTKATIGPANLVDSNAGGGNATPRGAGGKAEEVGVGNKIAAGSGRGVGSMAYCVSWRKNICSAGRGRLAPEESSSNYFTSSSNI